MRWTFWIVAVVSAVLAVLACIPAIVIVSVFSTGFLLAPLWPVAANLWWVMALLAPILWFQARGPVWKGVAVSTGLAIAWTGAFYGLRSAAMARIEAPFLTTPAVFADGTSLPKVVEVVLSADGVLGEAACDPLCDRLLTGDAVTTVRRITTGETNVTRVFRRSDSAECQALDLDFPAGAPCILLVADDGQPADLRITVDGVGDGYASRDEVAGLVHLVSSRRLRVVALGGGAERLLHDQSQRIWFEAVAPVPLIANAGFDGNGLHGGGLAPLRVRESDPPIDAVAVLAGLGLPMGPGRDFVETEPARMGPGGVNYPAKGTYQPAAYDVALIASVLDRAGGPDDGVTVLIREWVDRLQQGAPNTTATRAQLARLPAFLGTQAFMLERLTRERPEMFVEQFSDFYQQVQSEDEQISLLAASAILDRVRGDPFGTHDAEAEAYLAALESGKQWGYLIQVVGRYGFDPTQILRDELDKRRDGRDGPDLFTIFGAACRSDPKWSRTLGPFVHGLLLPMMDDIADNRDSVRDGSTALMALGRQDLFRDLFDRVDWTKVVAREAELGMNQRRLDLVQQTYFNLSANANSC